MSEIFGSKDRFAVEYELLTRQELDAVFGPGEITDADQVSWLFGRICFWVTELMVGDYRSMASLTVALARVDPQLLHYRGTRHAPEYLTRPALDAFHEIHSALYVDSGQSEQAIDEAEQRFRPLVAVPVGFDVFDPWMAYLIEDDHKARYLWIDPGKQVDEAWLAVGEFDRAVEAFLEDLERRSGRQRARE